MQTYWGEIAALLTAVFWTVTSMAFESAGKKVGSLAVNLIRLVIAFFIYSAYTQVTRGMWFPFDANAYQWFWLAASGIVGFVIGDLLLFQAFVVIGARISMLMMAMTPPFTAFISYFVLDEVLSLSNWIGMAITLCGISMVILKREAGPLNGEKKIRKRLTSAYSVPGILLALGGALGQATGLVMSKKGMGDYDAFAASQIRVMSGIVGFAILLLVLKRYHRVWAALKNISAMKRITLGSFFGPFLGVSFSLIAIQNTKAGIAATIMAIVPVLIIPPAILIFKEKVNWKEIIGAVITVIGVAIFFV
ncbi:DMT family transporter [Sunxiuqinia indica]|uniref:DMT family transporter n=1 Tax=Sunxiuqinia indica TaxID=2692584 RepID=UPI001357F4E5|nr:DMT family transporter [Sunxiuqinia indica]